jgi:hypothetical protein
VAHGIMQENSREDQSNLALSIGEVAQEPNDQLLVFHAVDANADPLLLPTVY